MDGLLKEHWSSDSDNVNNQPADKLWEIPQEKLLRRCPDRASEQKNCLKLLPYNKHQKVHIKPLGKELWKAKPLEKVLPIQRHCTMCCLGSMFSFQPNKLRHILKFMTWYIIQHIFVPACSVGRKTWFSRKPWFSNSKFGISRPFWLILSVPKIMFLVPENEKRNKF